jgi:hypothetical protein
MSWYYNFSMKTDHIPILSYVFIGVTSLVLTYATIADTTDEIILPPPTFVEPEASVSPESKSSIFSAVPAIALPTLSGTIDKLKSLNPFSTATAASTTGSGQEEIPVAVPVPASPSAPPAPYATNIPMNKFPSSGGKKSIKHRKRKQKKTRRSSK